MRKAVIWDDAGYWMISGLERFKRWVVTRNYRKMSLESLRTSSPMGINSLAWIMTILYSELDDHYELMRVHGNE